jgi:hypothetical protein
MRKDKEYEEVRIHTKMELFVERYYSNIPKKVELWRMGVWAHL